MMAGMETGTLVVIVGGLLSATIVFFYNQLVALKNRYQNAFSQIDVQLQRRYELIPNLVETARAYLTHENETLTAVTEARNQAEARRQQVSKAQTSGTPTARATDGGLIQSLANAESSVAGALGRMNMVMEAYPDLKADKRLSELHDDIVSTENRVSFSRQAYSDAVMRYNTACEQFPAAIVAKLFRFEDAELFEAANDHAREAVKVSFG